MTNEEAIKKLKSFCHNCSKYPQCVNTDRECFEALDMAIEALKQTDGDLISRDFMKELGATCIAKRSETGELVAISSIDNLPSAEQTDFEWCKGCKEYDTEKHCCHRYSSFIRESLQENINAVLEDIKAEIKEKADYSESIKEPLISAGLYLAIDVINKHISGKE